MKLKILISFLTLLMTTVLPGTSCAAEVLIDYQDGNGPICNAGFRMYRVGEYETEVQDGTISDQLVCLIGEKEELFETDLQEYADRVIDAYAQDHISQGRIYTGYTDDKGILEFKDLEEGCYLLAETEPAEGYRSCAPMIIRIVNQDNLNSYTEQLVLQPKAVSCGSIRLIKHVSGETAEYDRSFHVSVVLNEERDYAFPYITSDGSEGICYSGDELEIRNEEWIRIMDIPAGTEYEVNEKEAGKDGYQTTIINKNSRVEQAHEISIDIYNSREPSVDTGDVFELRAFAVSFISALLMLVIAIYHTAGRIRVRD